jgi:hypothetical protein
MIALVLFALLGQPAPAAATTPPSALAPAPVVSSQPEASPTPQIAAADAVIRNSGSTNTSGYTIVVHPDDSADVIQQGTVRHVTLAEPQAKWLFAKLKEDGPLPSLGAGHCMKSASFGTSTSISYEGASTPDLSCPSSDASRELSRTVGVIVTQLGVNPAVRRFRLPTI